MKKIMVAALAALVVSSLVQAMQPEPKGISTKSSQVISAETKSLLAAIQGKDFATVRKIVDAHSELVSPANIKVFLDAADTSGFRIAYSYMSDKSDELAFQQEQQAGVQDTAQLKTLKVAAVQKPLPVPAEFEGRPFVREQALLVQDDEFSCSWRTLFHIAAITRSVRDHKNSFASQLSREDLLQKTCDKVMEINRLCNRPACSAMSNEGHIDIVLNELNVSRERVLPLNACEKEVRLLDNSSRQVTDVVKNLFEKKLSKPWQAVHIMGTVELRGLDHSILLSAVTGKDSKAKLHMICPGNDSIDLPTTQRLIRCVLPLVEQHNTKHGC